MTATKSKYNNKKVEVDGFTFDSKAELLYYQNLKALQEREGILFFRLQPRYLLQEAFKKNGKIHRKIEYVAYFEIHHTNGTIEVVDIKGFETTDFNIKKKLFEWRYPHNLTILSFSQIDGGFIELDKLKKARSARKKAKSLKGK